MMYTVWTYDEAACDDIVAFEGSLEECLEYMADDKYDELYMVEPDGFTVYE